MSDRAKTYINDLISIDSIVTVYYLHLTGGSTDGDRHNFWEFQYVDRGNFQIMLDGKRFDADCGQFILYPPDAVHSGTGEKYDARIGIVSFESSSPALDTIHSKIITLTKMQKELLSDIITNGVDIFVPAPPESGFVGLVPKSGTSSSRLQKLKHQLEMFLSDIYFSSEENCRTEGANKENYRKSQFLEIEDYMKDNIDTNLSLEDLSEKFSISVSKLKSIFKVECDQSPIAYFTSLKIKEAKRLIKQSTLNFTQISESLGFSSVHYFSKLFKEKTGLTPSEYAKSIYKK